MLLRYLVAIHTILHSRQMGCFMNFSCRLVFPNVAQRKITFSTNFSRRLVFLKWLTRFILGGFCLFDGGGEDSQCDFYQFDAWCEQSFGWTLILLSFFFSVSLRLSTQTLVMVKEAWRSSRTWPSLRASASPTRWKYPVLLMQMLMGQWELWLPRRPTLLYSSQEQHTPEQCCKP